MAAEWNRPLPALVETRDGKKFTTLKDAAEFTTEQPERNEWLSAAGALVKAAESGKSPDIAAAHQAFRNALFVDDLRLKV